jgi:hypothetical protein
VDKTFGDGEGKMKGRARTEVELGLTAFVGSFEFCYEAWGRGGALGAILMSIWGATLGRNFDFNICRAA